jgi:hypothetical protein
MALFDDYYPMPSQWADRLVMVLEQTYQRWREESKAQPLNAWERGYRQAKDQDALELQRILEELVPGWLR